MKYLFLILSLLGLATYGDVARTPGRSTSSRIGLTTDSVRAEGIVSAMEGEPIPPRRK